MEPSPERQKDPWRKQRAALASVFASAALSLAKLVADLLSGSLALVSEGAHNLLATGSSALTFFAVREADKPADEEGSTLTWTLDYEGANGGIPVLKRVEVRKGRTNKSPSELRIMNVESVSFQAPDARDFTAASLDLKK